MIAQQTYANYKGARAPPAVAMRPTLAQLFGISVDELLGLKNGTGKRGPTPLLQKQIERLNRLPLTLGPHLRWGTSRRYWPEFLFEAYANHHPGAIFLKGLPDVAESRPHARESVRPSDYD